MRQSCKKPSNVTSSKKAKLGFRAPSFQFKTPEELYLRSKGVMGTDTSQLDHVNVIITYLPN
jgi:hypothetical protein